MTLDELFKEAKRSIRVAKTAKEVLGKPVAPAPSEQWTNPDNWREGNFIALIHTETQTVLGTFRELLHVKVPDARRLIRTAPGPVNVCEYVSGDWWINGPELPPKRETWMTQSTHRIVLHLTLGVFNPAALVVAVLDSGKLVRVELASVLIFAAGDRTEQLQLPAGTNILEIMTLESKQALWAEVSKHVDI